MTDIFITPFVEYQFMSRALLAILALAICSGPVGVILVLRRMSLMGDALSHAILPGIALGYLVIGVSIPALTAGGIIAGLVVGLMGGVITRKTVLTEDASFTGFYLVSLSLGILLLSLSGGNMNLSHFLFGTILAVDKGSLIFISITSVITLGTISIIYRPLIYDCFDPHFLKVMGIRDGRYHLLFIILVVLCLVAACQAIGTLMALGIMLLPAIIARLLTQQILWTFLVSSGLGCLLGYIGLVASFHYNWPTGPTIVLGLGIVYLVTLLAKTRA